MSVPDWARRKELPKAGVGGPLGRTPREQHSGVVPPGGKRVAGVSAPSGGLSRRSPRRERSERHRRSRRRRRRAEDSERDPPRDDSRERVERGERTSKKSSPREVRPREERDDLREFVPSRDIPKRICLGKTTGVMAAGAWAAREEIAKLIEDGFGSQDILKATRDAREEGPDLEVKAKQHPRSDEVKPKEKSSSGTPRGGARSLAESSPGSSNPQAWNKVFTASSIGSFRKQAFPPAREDSSESREEGVASKTSGGYNPSSEEFPEGEEVPEVFKTPSLPELGGDLDAFRKKAARPKEVALPKKGASPPRYVPKAFPRRSNPSEQQKLEDYFKRTRSVFEALVVGHVKMDLVGLVADDKGNIDDHKFKIYTEPCSVGTGLRYARLMEKLVNFHEEKFNGDEEAPLAVSKELVLMFLEWNIEQECGFKTPKAVLYAVEFYAIIFGFEEPGSRWPRCKKLADDYARRAPERNPADYFDVQLLDYLEKAVLNPARSMAERITCGKLRLCAQASIRHDDLTNTPLSGTEWCRLKGGTSVLGLRARAPTSKTGPRPWVASYLGVNPANDEWLRVFMELVLMIQDPAWKVRSFFVPGFVKDEVAAQPSSISADVNIVKRMMMYDIKAEKPVPLPKEGVEKLRWHGCKATMPTFMSHFNIRGKVIRYQGAWAKKADTMPDTYLREAQVIVLKGQIETLERIRAGESISALVGVGLNPGAPGAAPTDGASQTGEMPSGSPEELKRADAMAPAACKPTLAKDESGKVHFVEGELPDSSNFPDQLIDERLRDLTEKKVSSRELFAMLADENAEAAAFSEDELEVATEALSVDGGTPLRKIQRHPWRCTIWRC